MQSLASIVGVLRKTIHAKHPVSWSHILSYETAFMFSIRGVCSAAQSILCGCVLSLLMTLGSDLASFVPTK